MCFEHVSQVCFVNIQKLNRQLINSLRNTPNDWTAIKQINNTIIFTFISNNMFEADVDNLKEELNYIDNIISYNIYYDIYSCKQSDYDIMQENNDNSLFTDLATRCRSIEFKDVSFP